MPVPPIEDLIALGLNFSNLILAIALTIIYGKTLKTIKSPLTWGLLIFSLAFILENLSNLFWLGTILRAGDYGLTIFQLTANIIEMVALIVLVRLSLK